MYVDYWSLSMMSYCFQVKLPQQNHLPSRSRIEHSHSSKQKYKQYFDQEESKVPRWTGIVWIVNTLENQYALLSLFSVKSTKYWYELYTISIYRKRSYWKRMRIHNHHWFSLIWNIKLRKKLITMVWMTNVNKSINTSSEILLINTRILIRRDLIHSDR